MYTTGHYGAAMLVYAPVGAALLAHGSDAAALTGGVVMLALSMSPDVDHRIPFVDHRGPTHTVGFALLVGAVVGAVGVALGAVAGPGGASASAAGWDPSLVADGDLTSAALLGVFGFSLGVLAVGSHLLADVITPKGVAPFWPVSTAHYTLSWTRADNPVANYALLAAGVAVAAATLLVGRV